MPKSAPHRKRVQHVNSPGHAHLLTFSCYRRLPLLSNDLFRSILARGLDAALEGQDFMLLAFVFMPEHVHLLIWPKRKEYDISRLLFAIKRPTSFRIKADLKRKESPLLSQLTVRERPGELYFRFWQEGSGHDRNLISRENCIKAAEYIHHNPVRRKLVPTPDRWKWSSWNFYFNSKLPADPGLPTVHGFPP